MTTGGPIEIVDVVAFEVDGLALLDSHGAVWRTFARPWWDISSWLWWWLTPGRKQWVQLRRPEGKVRIRAVRLSSRHVRIG